MPFVKNTDQKNLQQLPNNRRIFVGRTNEIRFFTENILKPEDPAYNIISISGQAGIGKSTLLARFIDEARATNFKDYCLTALVNEQQTTPASMMEKFADQLHLKGDFEKNLTWYNDALRKLQIERHTTREAFWHKATTDIAGLVVKDIPIVGGVLEKGAELGIGYALDELHYHNLLKDRERLEDPIRDLTEAFVKELNKHTEIQVSLPSNHLKRRQRVILFFDTFEQLAPTAAPWLLDYFLQANISNNVILVVAGRDSLDKSTPDDPKRWLPYYDNNTIYSIPLDSFTPEETRTYLSERGISNTKHLDTLLQLSQGLPLFLGLLTSNPQGDIDPTADVVANFLRWIPEQEKIKRRLALDTALLSRPFNQDDLEVFTYLPKDEDERATLYSWLTGHSFIRSSLQGGRYSYHSLAQELFSRYLYQRSQKEYYATRSILANYYQEMLMRAQTESGEKLYYPSERLELVLALAHQLFSLPDETSHIEAIRQIIDVYQHTSQTEEIVRYLRNLSQERHNNQTNSGVRQIAKWLLRFIEADQQIATLSLSHIETGLTDNQQELIAAISSILEIVTTNSSFSIILAGTLYHKRGKAYHELGKDHQALEDFDRTIELDSGNAEAFFYRSCTYYTLKENEKALLDIENAIKLDPKFEHTGQDKRGAIFVRTKNYKEAIEAFTKAIIADPGCNTAWEGLLGVYHALYSRHEIPELLRAIPIPNIYIVSAINRRATLISKIGLYQEALIELDSAIKLDPKNAETFINRGKIYTKLKQHKEALTDLNYAVDLMPDNTNVIASRGEFYYRTQHYEAALEDFNNAILMASNNDSNINYYNNHKKYKNIYTFSYKTSKRHVLFGDLHISIYKRGMTYRSMERYQEALADFDHLIELYPTNLPLLLERGYTYRQMERYQEALADFDRLIELDASFSHPCQKERGVIFNKLNMDQDAIDAFIKALKAGLACVDCWTLLAKTYKILYPQAQIANLLKEAITLDGRDSAIACRALAMKNIDLYGDSLADLTDVIERNPDWVWAITKRGNIYYELKQYEKALADFDLAISLDKNSDKDLEKKRDSVLACLGKA